MVLAVNIECARAAAAKGAAGPVQDDAAGKRAWDLLGGLYKKGERGESAELNLAVDEAMTDVGGKDAGKAKAAGELILALFRQAAADEENGRAEWVRSMAWGGGANSQARNFRKMLAEKTGTEAKGEAAVPVAEWLLKEERLTDAQGAAVEVLERTKGTAGDAALVRILDKGVHFKPALVMALEECGKRTLEAVKEKPELLKKWATDARESVREAAREAMQKLGLPEAGEFKPEEGFSDAVHEMLADMYALMTDPPPVEAEFGRFFITDTYEAGRTARLGRTTQESTTVMMGWRRSKKDGVTQVVSWHGEESELKEGGEYKRKVRFLELNPAEPVKEIRELRDAKDREGRDKLVERLSKNGNLTGQFEPRQMSAPEGFLAAWLFKKGDLANAAALIFPVLDEMADDRWPLAILADLAGNNYHQKMLDAFAYERDYAKTLRLAKHLSQPLFAEYQYHERAKEMAEQLPKRMDDFKTLTLPTAEEWKKTTEGMAREKQMEFLASRLRLVNCFQIMQPGGVSYSDEQYREAAKLHSDDLKRAVKVINPYNELNRMRLLPADVAVLAPYLKDDNFLPTYSYWRNFHPGRTLHRVNWLVAELVNDAARRTLIDLKGWQNLTSDQRDEKVAAVTAWSKEMAGKSLSEILRVNLTKAADEEEWFRAAREVVETKDAGLLPDVLAGEEKYPERKHDIAEICYWLNAPEAAKRAGVWVKLKDRQLKLYAALILAKHGTAEEKTAAAAAVKKVLAEKWEGDFLLAAIEPVVSVGDEALTGMACELLKRAELDWDYRGAQAAHRLFLTKHPAALAALLELLESDANPKEDEGEWEEKEVKRMLTRGDRVAEAVARMRTGDYSYPRYAPDGKRAEERKALGAWLKTQAGLLKEGKATPELDTEAPKIQVPQWQIDAP